MVNSLVAGILLLVFSICLPSTACAYDLPSLGRHEIKEGRFHILVPSHWAESKDKLMVVSLHGSGEDGGYIWNWDPFAETSNILVVCPTSENPQGWSPHEIDRIIKLTSQVREHYGAHHVLLSGASSGGQMALMIGLLYPNHFDAIQTFMGLVPAGFRSFYTQLQQPEKAARIKIPILMIQGQKDPFISMDTAKESYRWLKAQGFRVTFVSRPNMKHEHYIPDNGFILQWLRAGWPQP